MVQKPTRSVPADTAVHEALRIMAWPQFTALLGELLRGQDNARVLLGEAAGVERDARRLRLADGSALPYDFLVLATGARHSYFGRDDWEPYAPGLKQIDDATAIRRRILLAFEHAEHTTSDDERRQGRATSGAPARRRFHRAFPSVRASRRPFPVPCVIRRCRRRAGVTAGSPPRRSWLRGRGSHSGSAGSGRTLARPLRPPRAAGAQSHATR
mgnify:CR=1 FL=1